MKYQWVDHFPGTSPEHRARDFRAFPGHVLIHWPHIFTLFGTPKRQKNKKIIPTIGVLLAKQILVSILKNPTRTDQIYIIPKPCFVLSFVFFYGGHFTLRYFNMLGTNIWLPQRRWKITKTWERRSHWMIRFREIHGKRRLCFIG